MTCSLCFLAVLGRGGAWYPKAILLTIFMTDSFVRARLVARRLREFALRMFREITNKIIGADTRPNDRLLWSDDRDGVYQGSGIFWEFS